MEWDKITEFDEPKQSPGFLLWQVSTRWRREIEVALTKLGVTHAQFVLLASVGWLTRHGEDVTQAKLARQCSLDITMTSQVLRSLEKKKLLTRHHSASDARSRFPRLTDEGAKLVATAIPLVESIDRKFFGKNAPKCVALLQKLVGR